MRIRDNCSKYRNADSNIQSDRISLSEPFVRVHIDIIGPLPKTESGTKYIIVTVDSLTCWPESRTVKNKSSHTVAQFIIAYIITKPGTLKQCVSDQGKEFLNEAVNPLCRLLDTFKSRTVSYNLQFNGTVERFNKTILDNLMEIVNENFAQWGYSIRTSSTSIRICSNSRMKCSLFEILYGRVPTLLSEGPIYKCQDNNNIQDSFAEYDNLIEKLQLIARKQNIMRTTGKIPTDLNVGEIVYRKRHALEKNYKRDFKWDGLYQIIQNKDNGNYLIRGLDVVEKIVNRRHLRRGGDIDFEERKVLEQEQQTVDCLVKHESFL